MTPECGIVRVSSVRFMSLRTEGTAAPKAGLAAGRSGFGLAVAPLFSVCPSLFPEPWSATVPIKQSPCAPQIATVAGSLGRPFAIYAAVVSPVERPSLAAVSQFSESEHQLKGLLPVDATAVHDSIEGALDRLYRAVALDIDGTLTADGSNALDSSIVPIVQDLLRRGIPVILVTGRGRESAEDAFQQLQPPRPDQSPGRLHCLIRNGSSLLRYEGPGSGTLVERSYATASLSDERVWGAVEKLTTPPTGSSPQLRTSTEGRNSIRLEYRDEEQRDQSAKELALSLESEGIFVRCGRWRDIHTVDISTMTKSLALTKFASELGLEPEEILRIGDRGDPEGNDYDLLDSVAGFSVDRFSRSATNCHPVIGGDGNAITGPPGTIALLQGGLTIAPPLRRPHDTVTDTVVQKIALAEQIARAGAEATAAEVRRRMASSMMYLVDSPRSRLTGPADLSISEVFDNESGAVRVTDAELYDLIHGADAVGTDVFDLRGIRDIATQATNGDTDTPRIRPSMTSDSDILLRGSLYYFGEAVPREKSRIRDYLRAARQFAELGLREINELAERDPTLARLKIVLGIGDNIRSYLLQLVFLAWVHDSEIGESYDLLPAIVSQARVHTRAYLNLLLNNSRPWTEALNEYAESGLAPAIEMIGGLAEDSPLLGLDESKYRGDLIRLRECDHLLDNATSCLLGLRKHVQRMGLKRGDRVTLYGLPYGGIELPILSAELGFELGLDVVPGYLRASFYNEDSQVLRKKRFHLCAELETLDRRWTAADADGPVLIVDDNSTTGGTLQLAIDILKVAGIDVDGAILVQYPMANRRRHMELDGHGCLDPEALLGFVRGLVSPTPFTRLLVPGTPQPYRDRQNVFNRAKRRIQRLIFNNFLTHRDPDLPE